MNIKDLYLFISSADLRDTASRRINNIISKLSDNNINTYYMMGDPSYWNKVSSVTKRIDYADTYNSLAGSNEKIKGIVLDIEPYTDPDFKTNKIENFKTYVSSIETIANYAKEKGLKIVNCIPRWYDSSEDYGGVSEDFENLIKIVDRTSVMNYVTNPTFIKKDISNEVKIAKKYGKEVETIAEFGKGTSDSFGVLENPLGTLKSAWKTAKELLDASEDTKYDKLFFSYHYYNEIAVLDGLYDYVILSLQDENGNEPASVDLIINDSDGRTYIKKEIDSTEKILVTNKDNYLLFAEGYELCRIDTSTDSDTGYPIHTYVVKEKQMEECNLEIYLKKYGTEKEDILIPATINIVNVESGIAKNVPEYQEASRIYSLSRINTDTKYKVTVKIDDIEYPIKSIVAKNTAGNYISVADGNENYFNIPTGFKTANSSGTITINLRIYIDY